MAIVRDCDLKVKEFELKSRYYARLEFKLLYFRTNAFGLMPFKKKV